MLFIEDDISSITHEWYTTKKLRYVTSWDFLWLSHLIIIFDEKTNGKKYVSFCFLGIWVVIINKIYTIIENIIEKSLFKGIF